MSLEEFASEARAGMSDGGRIGFFRGALADTQGPAGGQAMSPGTGATGGTRSRGRDPSAQFDGTKTSPEAKQALATV